MRSDERPGSMNPRRITEIDNSAMVLLQSKMAGPLFAHSTAGGVEYIRYALAVGHMAYDMAGELPCSSMTRHHFLTIRDDGWRV